MYRVKTRESLETLFKSGDYTMDEDGDYIKIYQRSGDTEYVFVDAMWQYAGMPLLDGPDGSYGYCWNQDLIEEIL